MNDTDLPLTPEEQEIAMLLKSRQPRRAPNPAMDASILAAAREAVAPSVTAAPRRSWKWAAPASLVATVAVSGFLLLRHGSVEPIDPTADTAVSESTDAAAESDSPAAQTSVARVATELPMPIEAPPAKSMPRSHVPVLVDAPSPQPATIAVAPTTAPIYAPPPMATPAPPPAPPAPMSPTVNAIATERGKGSSRAAEAASAPAAKVDSHTLFNQQPAVDSATAEFSVIAEESPAAKQADMAVSNVPVSKARAVKAKTADGYRAPTEWLAKIEKFRQDGELSEAKTSLREFRKEYPEHVIPETLRPLLD